MPSKVKPKFLDFANSLLNNDILKNALSFNEHLRDNGLTADKVSKYFWAVKYEGTRICTISVRKDSWWIRFFGRYDGSEELLDQCEEYLSEEIKNLILDNIRKPGCKNGDCTGYISKLIFGKMFYRVCWCSPFILNNPDGKSLEYAKEIVLICKKTAADITIGKAK